MNWENLIGYLLIIVVAALCMALITKMSTPIEVDLNGYTMQKSDVLEGDIQDFIVLGARFAANHEYSNENGSKYNCRNYTNDLAAIAQELGFKVEKVRGWPCDNCTGHAWLRLKVDYEPQTGKFADFSKTHPIQEVIE